MNDQNIKHTHRITALILVAAVVFYLFFQVNKRSPFVEANPFAVDPYDAVGSIAIQVALLVSILTYARILRWRYDPSQKAKVCLILHGNLLVLASIFITLCTDVIAELLISMPGSYWVNFLRIELGFMIFLTIDCGLALWVAFRHFQTPSPPTNLTPADAIDDLWSLVQVPVLKAAGVFPSGLVGWVKRFNSDWLFKRTPWIDPRLHPWRFACTVGLLVGVLLVLVQLQEGSPPSLTVGLLTVGIFLTVEFVATLVGYAIFGGYLGLRPVFGRKDG
jgi:hypothetical protein